MGTRLLSYNPHTLARQMQGQARPGFDSFISYFKFYGDSNSGLLDRSGTIRWPLRMKTLFPLPRMRETRESLEEICDARALELLGKADEYDVPLYVLWSGGIDSTLVLVSLLKNASSEQRARLVVLMTEASIIENRNFYTDFVRGTLRTESTSALPYLLGSRNMLVGGEGNDQVFGSGAIYKRIIEEFGHQHLTAPYDRELFESLYMRSVGDARSVKMFLDMSERLQKSAPVPLSSNADFAWWEKFCMKWQCVFTRKLMSVSERNAGALSGRWAGSMYHQFYVTESFELWSMNNRDKRIRDTWQSYKWPCKDIIYDFTRDAEYRDTKTKRGSLHGVFANRKLFSFIDETYAVFHQADLDSVYEPLNDFVD